MMNEKEITLNLFREKGKADAIDLRKRSPEMDGTALIDEEEKIPLWDKEKDYTSWQAGNPISYMGQVYKLLQPHNAAHYEGSPETLKALWGIQHTKNADKAKPFVSPDGLSGAYMKDECCTEDEKTFRSKVDNNVYAPSAYPANWEELI